MSRLIVNQVRKKIKDKEILSDIPFSVETGEIVGLLGRNGCGKSTLFKILFGILKPDYADLYIDDQLYSPNLNFKQKNIDLLP